MKHLVFLLMSFMWMSCHSDESSIDKDLNAQLDRHSGGEGSSFYQLPDSDEFNKIPQDPKNPLTKAKVELGKKLFHETAFATAGEFPITTSQYSCASCHHAAAGFQSGLAQGLGEGGEGIGVKGEGRRRNLLCDPTLCDVQPLRSPSVLNTAYQPLMLWSGQFGSGDKNIGTESQWTPGTPKATNDLGFEGLETQAIAGLGVHRLDVSLESIIANGYKEEWDEAFGNIKDEIRYTHIYAGLAIAAYERTVMANQSPWQQYLKGNNSALTDYQKEGAVLFFDKGQCVSCHNGPSLNDTDFHALAMSEFDPAEVIHYDTEDPAQTGRHAFTKSESDMYKFKTPQLYNLKDVAHFGHGASFSSIEDIVMYKNRAVKQNEEVDDKYISSEFQPLQLSDEEISKITAFLKDGLYDPNLERFVPSSLPSGLCFPNNDEVSQIELGCN